VMPIAAMWNKASICVVDGQFYRSSHMQPKISVITATLNSAPVLPRLVASLQAQTDHDFEWVVADGASTDETLAILAATKASLNVLVDSRMDFGIYDALNRAVRLASGDYYLVLGADDIVFPDAIARFRAAVRESSADLVTAKVMCDGQAVGPRQSWGWLHGAFAEVGCHAVGTLIRKQLHDRVGYYSRAFPIAADQLFLKLALRNGARVCREHFVAGEFDSGGTSGADVLGSLCEGFRIQVRTGENLFLQLGLLVFRVLKNWRRVAK